MGNVNYKNVFKVVGVLGGISGAFMVLKRRLKDFKKIRYMTNKNLMIVRLSKVNMMRKDLTNKAFLLMDITVQAETKTDMIGKTTI